jgi:hypothetical protein
MKKIFLLTLSFIIFSTKVFCLKEFFIDEKIFDEAEKILATEKEKKPAPKPNDIQDLDFKAFLTLVATSLKVTISYDSTLERVNLEIPNHILAAFNDYDPKKILPRFSKNFKNTLLILAQEVLSKINCSMTLNNGTYEVVKKKQI